jgi:aminopeptidase N
MASSSTLRVAMTCAIALLTACTRPPAPGVALELAEHRARVISELSYDVHFDVPALKDSAVTGSVDINLELLEGGHPLVLDFRAPADHVLEVRFDGARVEAKLVTDHIVLPAKLATAGAHLVQVRFRSSDAALNRNAEFMYALFVPDRASTAFPVFEQPDLKARFNLSLTVPAAWKALSNGAVIERDSSDAAVHSLRFAETKPISTYLFTFAAGLLQEERAERGGRSFTMYHRETDSVKVRRNVKAIFDLHATALSWLEDYTGIPYPFEKFEFFAVPSFQFGGMEHPGAVWYNARSLFLDESAGRPQELGRASLIAHETAHMWFGDLVTMQWFNDVWMKEVFANLMAAKIVGPSFPDIDQQLRFFQAHHPAAYGVDRTMGANPIRQPLENLREAGSLYGAVIYQKAPIVMKQLETMLGDSTFRSGLRLYLARHQFGNATWPDLVGILDSLSPLDVTEWSRVWVEEPGRPAISAWRDGRRFFVQQTDTWPGRSLTWPQRVQFSFVTGDTIARVHVDLDSNLVHLNLPPGVPTPEFILGGSDGQSYGRFALDSAGRVKLMSSVQRLRAPLLRAVAWQTLQEELIAGGVEPTELIDATLRAAEQEPEEVLVSQALGVLRATYWRFLDDSTRRRLAPNVERRLWTALAGANTAGRKGTLFSSISSLTLSDSGVARLEAIWRERKPPTGLPLSEQQYTSLAEALAVRGVANAKAILDEEASRITNADRRARFAFVRPALSADSAERARFFDTLKQVENRRQESWVLDAVGYVNHPLRAESALPLLMPSLELVQEIQQTGDIFFPLRWMDAVLDGHRSAEAKAMVREFLDGHPNYPPRLRGKMLQAADLLLREGAEPVVRR